MMLRDLHNQKEPLLICNVWDVPSAKLAEKLNFKVIGTSSAAIANMLGYIDGKELRFSELFPIIKRIKTCTTLPLSVDLESGYGENAHEIVANIKQLAAIGVTGINIEDSIVETERRLLAANDFARIVSSIKTLLHEEEIDMFINVVLIRFCLITQM